MGIAEEYVKRVKTPLIKVTVTTFLEGALPGIDTPGNDYYPEVVSCDITYGFDQASTNCTLELKTPLDVDGNYVRFAPMNRVKVEQGWNVASTYRTTFFGFIDKVEYSNPPKTVRIDCRDILKLAQDNYLIHSNRMVYSATPSESEFDGDGNAMGGQAIEDRQAQEIIIDLLGESGIPESRFHTDLPTYPASGAIIIGNNATAVFVYESALDACTRITDLIGYRIWSDKAGHVQCREVRPIGTTSPSMTYQSEESTYAGNGTWTVTQSGNLLSVSAARDDDLRNWVTVYGWEGVAPVTYAGDSDYVPNPPRYRRTEIRSYLLDTTELLNIVASGIYNDLNRLRYTARITIEGDPRLEIGQTIRVYDSHAMTDSIDYFLYDFSSQVRAGQWTMDLGLVGGVGAGTEGSPPIGNVSPVAMFSYSVEMETLTSGTLYDLEVDASASYDPNGPIEELSYLWTLSGFSPASGITHTYNIDANGVYYVTLTVTDQGDPPLSSDITLPITLPPPEGVRWRMLWVVSGKTVYTSDNGGASWLNRELY